MDQDNIVDLLNTEGLSDEQIVEKIEGIDDSGISENFKAALIKQIKSDDKKIELLDLIKSERLRIQVIKTIVDEQKRKEAEAKEKKREKAESRDAGEEGKSQKRIIKEFEDRVAKRESDEPSTLFGEVVDKLHEVDSILEPNVQELEELRHRRDINRRVILSMIRDIESTKEKAREELGFKSEVVIRQREEMQDLKEEIKEQEAAIATILEHMHEKYIKKEAYQNEENNNQEELRTYSDRELSEMTLEELAEELLKTSKAIEENDTDIEMLKIERDRRKGIIQRKYLSETKLIEMLKLKYAKLARQKEEKKHLQDEIKAQEQKLEEIGIMDTDGRN